MRGFLGKVGGWWNRGVVGPDKDYGTALPTRGEVSAARPESAGAAPEEKIVRLFDKANTLNEIAKVATDTIKNPDPDPGDVIVGEVTSTISGLFRDVVVRVLAHLITGSPARDGNTTNPTGSAPERDGQSGQ